MTLKISYGQRLLHFLLLRQLCQNDRTEDQHTAKQFLKTQSLSQQHPASQYREHGLQTEKQGGYRRICIFLRYDLQGIRHSAGCHACRISVNTGCSHSRVGTALMIAAVRNWIADIFTPSTFGEK